MKCEFCGSKTGKKEYAYREKHAVLADTIVYKMSCCGEVIREKSY